MPDFEEIMKPLLAARRTLRAEFARLHEKVLMIARNDTTCRRLMTVPGVGPVVALAHTATIDIPQRFRNSKAVGPILRLTPKLNESGEGKRVHDLLTRLGAAGSPANGFSLEMIKLSDKLNVTGYQRSDPDAAAVC